MGRKRMGVSVRETRLGTKSNDVSYILDDRRQIRTGVDPEEIQEVNVEKAKDLSLIHI